MIRIFCNNCGNKKFWKLGNGEYRCKVCRKDFKPYPVKGLRFSKREWRKLVKLFLLGVNSPTLSTGLKKNIAGYQITVLKRILSLWKLRKNIDRYGLDKGVRGRKRGPFDNIYTTNV